METGDHQNPATVKTVATKLGLSMDDLMAKPRFKKLTASDAKKLWAAVARAHAEGLILGELPSETDPLPPKPEAAVIIEENINEGPRPALIDTEATIDAGVLQEAPEVHHDREA